MATWFSYPVDWQWTMTLRTQPDNSMYVLAEKGPIVLKALFDGFVVFRKTSADGAPVVGNLELVLTPGNWSDEMQKFFNPGHPDDQGAKSKFTELPPGRVVYRSLSRSDIETKLHKLIFDKFEEWRANTGKVAHRSLYYIIKPAESLTLLKDVLLDAWNKGLTDSDKKRRVDEEITKALAQVFDTGFLNPVGDALPVEGGDILASIGSDALPAELIFDICNFYGEPLNPHFYLRQLEKKADDLTPRPPFKPDDEQKPRMRASDQPLAVRIPRKGGAEFRLMKGASGNPPYQSQLIWTHRLDTSDADYPTKVEARPGQSITPPTVDARVQPRINAMWDNDHDNINTYAEFFSCPCELILATIQKEANQNNDTLGETHSIRFEPIEKTGPYARDYENLLKAGSPITKDCIDAYWTITGGWRTKPSKSFYAVDDEKKIETKDLPTLKLSVFVASTEKIGTKKNWSKISWAQIQKIETVNADLIKRNAMVLPPLGKSKTDVPHYKLIATQVGATVAANYFAKVGGIGGVNGDEAKPPTPFSLTKYPLPLTTKGDELVLDDNAAKAIKWKDLIALLKILKDNDVTNVPQATYVLQPLQRDDDIDFHEFFTIPKLNKLLGKPEDSDEGRLALHRYFDLMDLGIRFHEDMIDPKGPGVKRQDNPSSNTIYLTKDETIAMAKIYPHRISIGVGQLLLDTGARKLIDWVKKHYPEVFTALSVEVPDDGMTKRLTWLWTHVWEKRHVQIAFIAAYHKQNATVHWQAIEDDQTKKLIYKVGEKMTMFDFPRSGACYNSGSVRRAEDAKPDTPWGMVTFGDYQTKFWSAIAAAAKRFNTFSSPDPKWAKVRLRPDLETDSGMDAR